MKVLQIATLCVLMTNSAFSQEVNEIKQTKKLVEYSVNVYPNPSEGDIHINAPTGAICSVYSQKGTYVGTWETREGGLDLLGMPTGSYILIIKQEEMKTTKRFIIL